VRYFNSLQPTAVATAPSNAAMIAEWVGQLGYTMRRENFGGALRRREPWALQMVTRWAVYQCMRRGSDRYPLPPFAATYRERLEELENSRLQQIRDIVRNIPEEQRREQLRGAALLEQALQHGEDFTFANERWQNLYRAIDNLAGEFVRDPTYIAALPAEHTPN